MTVTYGRVFRKNLKKQPLVIREKFYTKLALFIKNSQHPLLGNHALHGEWDGCRSINITGDIRAVFEEVDDEHVEFVDIGTHSELYS